MSRLGALVARLSSPVPMVPAESFDPDSDAHASEIIRLQLRRPILLGMLVVLFLVFGLFVWAAVSPISNAVIAPGTVRVENNSKILRSREGGVVRQILVREGQLVRAGQPLLRFDPVQGEASVDIYQAVYDSARANIARLQAQALNSPTISFPPDLLARQGQPAVAALLAGQRALHISQLELYRSQSEVLRGQMAQLQTVIGGMEGQGRAADIQMGTLNQQLADTRELENLGYAPKARRLGLESAVAGAIGQRGNITASVARARQEIGNVRIQLAQLNERREAEAAAGLKDAQDKLADAGPKLRAVSSSLAQTVIRAPVDGRIFGLSQYTEGGVAAPGEVLMQIVPINTPMLITAHVPSNDISDLKVGLPARVTLTAYNQRTTQPVDGEVILVGADIQADETTKTPFYVVQVRVDPESLAKAGTNVRLTPGMPVQVAIVIGKRTIMDYLLAPFTDALRTAMHER